MDFNTFSNNRNNQSYTKAGQYEACDNETIVNESIDKYKNLTEEEAMKALFDAVNKEKQNGVFNIDNIRAFYKNISPMLSNSQREKMRGIIDAIGQF